MTAVVLTGAVVGAFVVRSLPWKYYLAEDGSYILFGPDCYDHLRRILLGNSVFPAIPKIDTYYGYPVGTGQIWAPLFDYLLSAFCLAIGLGKPSHSLVMNVAFWSPPVLAAITIPLVYVVAARLFGRACGLVAAVFAATLPAHILYSCVSRLDHHVAEPIACLMTILALLSGQENFASGKRAISSGLGAASTMVLALLLWRGAVLFWGVAFAALFCHAIVSAASNGKGSASAQYGLRLFLWTAAILFPVCLLDIWNTAGGFSSIIVSWFHVALAGACAAVFLVMDRTVRARSPYLPIGTLIAAVAICVALPIARRFLSELFSGIAIISGSDPWLVSISEQNSLLLNDGRLDFSNPTHYLSLVYWLVPAILFLHFRKWRQESGRPFGPCLFYVWCALFWPLPLLHLRYCHLAAIATAVAAGSLVRLFALYAPRIRPSLRFLIGGVVSLALLFSVSPRLREVPYYHPDPFVRNELFSLLNWMRGYTPGTSYFDHPVLTPEYGVLADWGLGAYIVNIARRPTVATNFGWETHGLFESALFHAQTDPEAALQVIAENRVRYVMVNQFTSSIDNHRSIAEYAVKSGRAGAKRLLGRHDPRKTMYFRLMEHDASAYMENGTLVRALGNYRLLHESTLGQIHLLKLFEVVPGAMLVGRGKPGDNVDIRLELRSPVGRNISYLDRTLVEDDGTYRFRVPYSSVVSSGIIIPLSPYQVQAGGKTHFVRVNEEDVRQGKTVGIH